MDALCEGLSGSTMPTMIAYEAGDIPLYSPHVDIHAHCQYLLSSAPLCHHLQATCPCISMNYLTKLHSQRAYGKEVPNKVCRIQDQVETQ